MDIDEQLINQNTEPKAAELAGDLRASKRGENPEADKNQSASLREMVQQKRAENTKGLKNNYEGDVSNNIPLNPIRRSTDRMLSFAWENLITSWGLTLLYIDAHVFLNKVFGSKVFCNPGEEWLPESIKKIADKSKSAASLIKIIETSGIGCLNLGCLFLIIFIASIISIIVSILTGDLSLIWDLFKGFLSDIASLFS